MNLLLKILLPVLIFIGAVFAAKKIKENKPEPRRWPQSVQSLAVDAETVKRSDYQVLVTSQGTVRPSREGALVPEVIGTINAISTNFVVGGFFQEGEILVEINSQDFEIALTQAEATRAQASAVVQEERARSKQAAADWKSLGRKGKPSSLTVRAPQLAAARANLASANAQIEKVRLDLARTKIVAPYAGRVLEKNVDIGEFVNRGAPLGRIHSLDAVEVRLPLSNRQLTHLSLPDSTGDNIVKGNVTLKANIGGKDVSWLATLVRCEGIDTTSQQLYCVAQVSDPYNGDDHPLRIGQYVKAVISGDKLTDVFVVPRASLREDREVILVDAEKKLQVQPVNVTWADDEFAAITEGLADGDVFTLTTLGAVANGTNVQATIDGVAPPPPARGQGGKGANGGEGKKGQRGGKGEGKPNEQHQGRPKAEGGNTDSNKASSNGAPSAAPDQEDRRARMQRLKAVIDSGGELSDEEKTQIRERIASGGRVPPWLADAVK